MPNKITTILLDIGGVLLTNGWDHLSRRRVAQEFGIEFEEFEARHEQTVDQLEQGSITFEQYLDKTVFIQPRRFDREAFMNAVYQQSQADDHMIQFFMELKSRQGLRIVAVSNESRELTAYRVERFNLSELVDVFVCSCFIGRQKPDPAFYQLALDLTQASKHEVVYIDDRKPLVDSAEEYGIPGFPHRSMAETERSLHDFGLSR